MRMENAMNLQRAKRIVNLVVAAVDGVDKACLPAVTRLYWRVDYLYTHFPTSKLAVKREKVGQKAAELEAAQYEWCYTTLYHFRKVLHAHVLMLSRVPLAPHHLRVLESSKAS